MERELLFIGDDIMNPCPGYTKVPRLVPRRIQRDDVGKVLGPRGSDSAGGSDIANAGSIRRSNAMDSQNQFTRSYAEDVSASDGGLYHLTRKTDDAKKSNVDDASTLSRSRIWLSKLSAVSGKMRVKMPDLLRH